VLQDSPLLLFSISSSQYQVFHPEAPPGSLLNLDTIHHSSSSSRQVCRNIQAFLSLLVPDVR
jgi:hypothetical protein